MLDKLTVLKTRILTHPHKDSTLHYTLSEILGDPKVRKLFKPGIKKGPMPSSPTNKHTEPVSRTEMEVVEEPK